MKQTITDITYRLRKKLEARLSAALTSQISEASNVFIHFGEFSQQAESGLLRVVFHAEYDPVNGNWAIVSIQRPLVEAWPNAAHLLILRID